MGTSRRFILTLVMLFAMSACGALSDDDTSADDPAGEGLTEVTFRLDWIVDGSHTAFFAALDQGFFRDEGLNVEILEGGGSGMAATLVGNGTDDFGFSDAGVVAKSIAEDVPVRMVMGMYQRSPSIILSLESSGIAGPEDLRGRRVGASPGEAPLQLLPAYLEGNGVDADEVEIVNIDPSAKLPALFEERVDAIVAYASSELPIAETEATEDLSIQYYSDFGIVALSNGIIAHPETLDTDPELVESFVRAVQRGVEYARDNPEAAAESLSDRFPQTVDPEQARTAVDIVLAGLHTERTDGEPIGFMDRADWEETVTTLEAMGALDEVLPLEEYFTNEFIGS